VEASAGVNEKEKPVLDKIKQEIAADPYYAQNYANDGQRFVAWYLRRVVLCDETLTKQSITDGANDKQIDAVVIDDATQRIIVVQGKFLESSSVDKEPLLEVLVAWRRMHDLEALQTDANDRLKARIEDIRQALADEYSVEFQLLTTGELTPAARDDLAVFGEDIQAETTFSATLQLLIPRLSILGCSRPRTKTSPSSSMRCYSTHPVA